MRKADPQFLSTSPDWDLEGMLRTLPGGSIPVSLVIVEPRIGKTGLLEERGLWIQRLWQEITSKYPEVVGLRTSWDQVVFFWPDRRGENVVKELSGLLRSSTITDLKSLAIFSTISGPKKSALRELERMQLQLTKIGYWKKHIFPSYYEDGVEVALDAT